MQEVTTITKIGDVVITDNCLSALEALQGENNAQVGETELVLLRTIKLLSLSEPVNDKLEADKKELIQYISTFIELLLSLKAPENGRKNRSNFQH